jgi:hypothetical protein
MSGPAMTAALIERVLDLRAARDFDRLETLLGPNVRYRLAGDRRLMPYAGAFQGRTDVCVAFQAIDTEFEMRDFRLDRPVLDGQGAAAAWSARWINRGTRDAALVEGLSLLRFEDGCVIDWLDAIDTATASYLAGWMPEMPAFVLAGQGPA